MEKKILEILKKTKYPIKLTELQNKLGKNILSKQFDEAINNLLLKRSICFSNKKVFFFNSSKYLYGQLSVNSRGFGFIKDANSETEYYVNKFDLAYAFDSDEVAFIIKNTNQTNKKLEKHKLTAKIVGVFNNNTHFVVGVIKKNRYNKYYLQVLSRELHQFQAEVINQKEAKEHLVIKAKIIEINYKKNVLYVEITEQIGNFEKTGVDISMIIAEHNLPNKFSEIALQEAQTLADKPYDETQYVNLQNECFVTIDGETAKDFDDAIFVTKTKENNFLLKVAIADVASYVLENSQLDKEALNRGCSVYLLDRVIPMLPEILSNDVCSLIPSITRKTMCCELLINQQGIVLSKKVYQAQIKSHARLTYTQVNKLYNKEIALINNEEVTKMLLLARKLYNILLNKKITMGIINLELKEPNFITDKYGKIIDVVGFIRQDAEKLIESFMISANEAVAEIVQNLKFPFIYRIHDKPQPAKLAQLYTQLQYLGINVNNLPDKSLPTILAYCAKKDSYEVIANLILRSMEKAKYSINNIGHFGLSSQAYTHFTSPIRRYPDLLVHRLLKEYIINKSKYLNTKTITDSINNIAMQANFTEQRSVDCEREVDQMKLAEFMVDKVGQKFSGIISGVTSFGFFVQLSNLVEGLIRLSDIKDDKYIYNEHSLKLVGQKTHKEYFMGQKVNITVKNVDKINYQIDFILQ